MQTHFTLAQLADPDLAESEKILRTCVHCGFCNATCPTYALLGDELDGPRGRIYLIKDMLEGGKNASPILVRHVDRCLSCLSCLTTCPSGVDYMHLVDNARARIEETYRRPFADRALRAMLAFVLPRPGLARIVLAAALLAKPLGRLLPRGRIAAMLKLARAPAPPSVMDRPQIFPAVGKQRKRVALLTGCVQQALAPEINESTIRLLTRLGCEVVVAKGAGCCGSLVHHLGRAAEAKEAARRNVAAWTAAMEGGGLDAVIANASGCGTMLKDYGHVLRGDPRWAAKAAKIAGLAKDVSEVVGELGVEGSSLSASALAGTKVAYHSACSLQHGQKIHDLPRRLLTAAGFAVVDPPDGHLCCGSAGTYNVLQPAIAESLRERKLAAIARVNPDIIAAGNIGCIAQLTGGRSPVVHTVELLDWATGGPRPTALEGRLAGTTG
ncbi:MAG: glycolate oxidase subunit GlcF [Rhodospirillaceae bacterium]|nr:glycolate oxidase subunit GlcF [Rhodospirillaceae bacterium]